MNAWVLIHGGLALMSVWATTTFVKTGERFWTGLGLVSIATNAVSAAMCYTP